jgi:hypothetical protein
VRIFIGWDEREQEAYRVAERSACRFGHDPVALREDRLRKAGLFTRPVDRRDVQAYDILSNAPQSTEFANSRFLVPILGHDGWALFTDCDVIFLRDPNELVEFIDPSKAVLVVKHENLPIGDALKMDRQQQTAYRRKNWSSVALWNCSHPANARLNLTTINQWPGRDLHAFGWLADEEIGELPPQWNWLVNVQPMPDNPAIAHFTLGGPYLKDWPGAEHDDLWLNAALDIFLKR